MPAYRNLWLGLLFLMAGISIQILARGYLTWDLSKSPVAVVLVGSGFAPPILLFSIFGGAVADRLSLRKIIQYGQLGVALIALFIGFSIAFESITIYHLVVSSLLQGTIWAFLMPARQAIIPELVDDEHITNATALNASGMSLMSFLAPGIGGLVYGYFGAAVTYYIIAAFAFIAFLMTGFVPSVRKKIPKKNFYKDIKEGFGYVAKNRTVLYLLVVALSTALLSMPYRTLLPVQIEEVFNKEVEALGLLLSAIGVGALIGTLFIAGLSKKDKRGWILIFTSILSGFTIMISGLNSSYLLAIVLMLFLGLGDSGRRALNISLILENTDDEYRGRVMGLYTINFGLIPLGAIPLGFIADILGIQQAYFFAGLLLIIFALGYTIFTTKIRKL